MIGRIVASTDFERVLGTPPRARSAHFAVHHLADLPSRARPATEAVIPELSTAGAPVRVKAVDDLPQPASVDGWWLGAVVPKRHARRSVTRTLLKRQIRMRMQAHAPALPPGLWVVRLRAPFDVTRFASAASAALRHAAGSELDLVFQRAAASPR